MHSVVLVSTALIVFSIRVSSTVMAMSNKYISPEKTQVNSKKYVVSLDKNTVVRVTQLKQINTSLSKCPVFVEMESQWSPVYRSMRPILEKLIAEYQGKATIASVDVDKSPEVGEYFGVESIPDSFVIVGIENGKYVYMQKNGKVSMDRSQARIIGLNGNDDEKVFEKIIDFALLQEGKSKSQ